MAKREVESSTDATPASHKVAKLDEEQTQPEAALTAGEAALTAGADATKKPPDVVIPFGPDARIEQFLDVLPEATRDMVETVRAQLLGTEFATFMLMGRLCTMRRRQLFFAAGPGADTAAYRFSRQSLPAVTDMPPLVALCIAFANAQYGGVSGGYNRALVNLYEDGCHYISPHADDEPEHEAGSPILTFSFGPTGGERSMDFAVKKKAPTDKGEPVASGTPPKRQRVLLPSGSCTSMCGVNFQTQFTHGIATAKKVKGWRLSVTVRKFNTPSTAATIAARPKAKISSAFKKAGQ